MLKSIKNMKKRFLVSFALVFALLSTGVSANSLQAQQKELPEGFRNMSIQQRIEWIEENIPATVHQGIRINNGQRGALNTYYASGHSEARMGDVGDLLGEMDTALEWSVDSSNPKVIVSYDQVDFTIKNYMSSDPPDGNTYSYWVNQGNVKYVFDGDIVGPFMGYYMFHDYNLHYGGNFSFRKGRGAL